MPKALTIKELEREIYDFVSGVLPTITPSGLYKIRFTGFSRQKDPSHIDATARNECFIRGEVFKPMYRFFKPNMTNSVECECEVTYSILLSNKETNVAEPDCMTQALRICAHRDGYPLFNHCGISKLEPVNYYVRAEKSISVFYAEVILKLVALIKLDAIKQSDTALSHNVVVYERDNYVGEIEMEENVA